MCGAKIPIPEHMQYVDMEKNEMECYLKHFSNEYSDEIIEYVEKILPDYIFTRKNKGKYYGFCTTCKKSFRIMQGFKHKDYEKCPECGKVSAVQSLSFSRKYMINEAYILYFEKSKIDPNAIVARCIYAAEDWTGNDYQEVKPLMADNGLYIFKLGEAVQLKRYVWYSTIDKSIKGPYIGHLEKTRTIFDLLNGQQNKERVSLSYSTESLKKAVEGNIFQYSCWDKYDGDRLVKLLDLYCKYPKAVEYLTKCGFDNIIDCILKNKKTYHSINWKGETLFKILKLSRHDIRTIRDSGVIITPALIKIYQINKNHKELMSFEEMKELENIIYSSFEAISLIAKYTSLKKAFNYAKEQRKLTDIKGKSHYYSIDDVLNNYKDYLSDCINLQMDLNNQKIVHPKNLHAAHQDTINKVKIKENKELNLKIKKRLPVLKKKYNFNLEGLFIRPAEDTKELIDEGKELKHCVGTYAQIYANAKTDILFIRQVSFPEKPYYTIEISNKKIVQVRGKCNCHPTKDIEKFIEEFKQQKLEGNKDKEREKITVPA